MTIELEPVDYYCNECDSILDATGCLSATCSGYRCAGCEAGCDVDTPDGQCERATRLHTYLERRRRWAWLTVRRDQDDWLFRGGECL